MLLSARDIMTTIWDWILIHKETISLRSISSLVKAPSRSINNHKGCTRQMRCTQLMRSHTTQMKIQMKAMTTATNTMTNLPPLLNPKVTNKLAPPTWRWTANHPSLNLNHLLTRKTKVKICSSRAATGKPLERQRKQRILKILVQKSSSKEMKSTSVIPMKHLALKIPKAQPKLLRLKDARGKRNLPVKKERLWMKCQPPITSTLLIIKSMKSIWIPYSKR